MLASPIKIRSNCPAPTFCSPITFSTPPPMPNTTVMPTAVSRKALLSSRKMYHWIVQSIRTHRLAPPGPPPALGSGPAPAAPPLAERFTIVEAPSATTWVRWRARPAVARAGVLGFADPVPAGDVRAVERSGARPVGRLPAARDEAREVAAALGGSSRVRVGPAATESAFKAGLPFDGAVVHLAAHAVVHVAEDRGHRGRVAVCLQVPHALDGVEPDVRVAVLEHAHEEPRQLAQVALHDEVADRDEDAVGTRLGGSAEVDPVKPRHKLRCHRPRLRSRIPAL